MSFIDDEFEGRSRDDDDTPDLSDDPESLLLRREQEDEEEEETRERDRARAGVLDRLDMILAMHSQADRRLFWLVFVEGMSIAQAAREAGTSGNVYEKFNRMMDAVRSHLGKK
jgi:DNA-directed RNA polymerase specialized sigma24 family protein